MVVVLLAASNVTASLYSRFVLRVVAALTIVVVPPLYLMPADSGLARRKRLLPDDEPRS